MLIISIIITVIASFLGGFFLALYLAKIEKQILIERHQEIIDSLRERRE